MRSPSSCRHVEVVDEKGMLLLPAKLRTYSSLECKALVLGVLPMPKDQVKLKVVLRKEHQKVLQSLMDPSTPA
jgi:DNA-binding transcriptional regulator/RsmH inhibitor MraZ